MNNLALNVMLAPLALLIYGSGLLLWPLRRWLRRKQKIRGKFLAIVFFVKLTGYLIAAVCSIFIRLGHFYYWFYVLIELNIVFTVLGMIAWMRDAHYERSSGTIS